MAVGNWTAAYQATPNGAVDAVSLGDNEFNTLKGYIYDRAKLEHNWSTQEGTYTDDGRHVPGSARAFYWNGPAGPGGLWKPDGSGPQTTIHAGGNLLLTGPNDKGRLWVDSLSGPGAGAGHYRLWVLDSAGAWQRVSASAPWAGATYAESVDAGIVDVAPAGPTTLTWPGPLQVVVPDVGNFRIAVAAKILLNNTNANARLVRVDLMVNDGGGATIRQSEEIDIRGNTMLSMSFDYSFNSASSTTYTFSFVGEASNAGVLWGYHANTLTMNGPDNSYHTCSISAPAYQ